MSKISELSDGGSLLPTDFLIAVRSGGNVKVQADQTEFDRIRLGDNEKIELGNSQDISIYWDGSVGKITNNIDVTGTVTATGILEASDGTNGEMQFGLGTALTTGAGTYDSSVRWNGSAGNLLFSQGAVEKMRITATGIDVTGDITLGDTNPTITFNDSSVTNLSHTISTSSDNLRIAADVNGVDAGSRVEIFDGTTEVARFEAGAVNVTGTVTADGLTVNSGATGTTVNFGNSGTPYATWYNDTNGVSIISADAGNTGAATRLQFNVGGVQALRINALGDVSFFDDSGSAKLFWDASAESLNVGGSTNFNYGINVGDAGYGINSTGVAPLVMRGTEFRLQGVNASPMTFYTSNAERMRIDSSGNVGINNNNPSAYGKFVVDGTGNILNVNATSGSALLQLYEGGSGRFGIQTLDGSAGAKFTTAGTERMRIDSSGNVGIGTSSALAPLHTTGTLKVSTGNAQGILALGEGLSPAVNVGLWRGAENNPTSDGNYLNLGGYDGISFATGAAVIGSQTTRLRIDSSGNLLVGKSVTTFNTEGFLYEAGAAVEVTTDSNRVMRLNRTTNDGNILEFNKDSTLVGSIGTVGGYFGIANGDTGLLFRAPYDDILPYTSTGNTAVDAAIDIGDGSYRFKDLYLSGGVYLGGTGAANKLDDYEEGTFTPTVTSGVNSLLYTNQSGTYTKIGNLVYFQFRVDLSSGTAAGSQFKFGGLPFTSANIANYGGAWISYSAGFLDDLGTASWHIGPNNTEVFAYEPDGSIMTGIELEAIGNVLGNVYLNGVYKV